MITVIMMIPCSNEYLDVDEYHDTGRNIKTWMITMIMMIPCSNKYLDVDEYHDKGRNVKNLNDNSNNDDTLQQWISWCRRIPWYR